MKHIILTSLLASASLLGFAQSQENAASNGNATTHNYVPAEENLQARNSFSDSRFGIFLHWGIYSMFAQGEWYLNYGINKDEYSKAADAFYPHRFNAKEWIEAIKGAGAKYICFTTRHHDGFSMWDTKQSDYNIMNTPYGKDVVRQLADECHKQGIGLHLYYSHIDWTRDDYPAGRTGKETGKNPKKADWSHYYQFMNAQLKELLTNYGKVDGIWFDGWWDHDVDSVPFNWQLPQQYEMIHRLQPACIIGNNHHQSPFEGEDMQMFERDIPGENKSGLSGQQVSKLPLETCQTMNGMWGYKVKDQNYKSTKSLIRLLVRTAAKGANLLLNIGPQPNGELPAAALDRLKGIGDFLNGKAGESIYKTIGGDIAEGDSIVSTAGKGKNAPVYIHLLSDKKMESITIKLNGKPKKAYCLTSGKNATWRKDRKTGLTTFFFNDMKDDEADYIIKVEF